MPWTPLPDRDNWTPRRVGDDLDELLRRAGGAGGTASATVFSRWEEAVGPAVAAHAQPAALRGTTLVVAVDGPAYATQLRLLGRQLLNRLSEIAGRGVVDAIEVTVRA
ncbi:MAG TPA: DciA family protein [Acidimicrobiales bacterium]|nr:DciA family protein [Acidimicrobiales bacterium]